ncbi:dTDP-4-dehydrorhamnose 3,5-epimerase [uncultured Dokdonia sp.]|uniref:dTDP-4-dehydrorhamnose 3,5-epimerase n=1 Tax=uncultured Dokdonia sp. TaxID=575653 RepID=UPI0026278D9C|nr:dTDP-4-dehydrorhamnose 3,5-epimerase [uncultured Dokdonia sp.]
MQIKTTSFKDLIICNPSVYKDERGYFYESYKESLFQEKTGLSPQFVQDNQSQSTYGVLRGLHFQIGEMAQAKLVRVIEGEVLDVVVDLRKEEPTFGQSFSIILSAENKTQLFIPRGFAHGFLVLSQRATFFYKCDNYYHKESELGLKFDDPQLGIDWQLDPTALILSEKDQNNPDFETLKQLL